MRHILASALLASSLAAQGILPLSGTYRFASLLTSYGNDCAPPSQTAPEFATSTGTVNLSIDGRYIFSGNDYIVCPNGQVQTGTDSGSGDYFVGDDGRLTFDDDGGAPGLEPFTLFVRADASLAVSSRKVCDDSAELFVLMALSSGQSNASLNGNYGVSRLRLSSAGGNHSLIGDQGTITFNGTGTYTESGTRQTVLLRGTSTGQPYTGGDSYIVAQNGALSTGAGAWGAVTPDREVFFWVTGSGSTAELTIGVRLATTYSQRLVSGRWGTSRLDHEIGASAPTPGVLSTEYGTLNLAAAGTALQWEFERVESRPSSFNACDRFTPAGSFTLSSGGALTLSPSGSTAIQSRVSSDGTVFAGLTLAPGSAGLILGLSRCVWPRRFGRPTAGSGALAPSLFSLGGFPYAGNAGFSFLLANGLGAAPGALLISLGSAAGLPLLGGTLWIDPTQTALQFPLVLSGPPNVPGVGAAGALFALPASASLAGTRFFAQGFLLDQGGPAGMAMSAGLEVAVCR